GSGGPPLRLGARDLSLRLGVPAPPAPAPPEGPETCRSAWGVRYPRCRLGARCLSAPPGGARCLSPLLGAPMPAAPASWGPDACHSPPGGPMPAATAWWPAGLMLRLSRPARCASARSPARCASCPESRPDVHLPGSPARCASARSPARFVPLPDVPLPMCPCRGVPLPGSPAP
ncbi:unnamed protein product, partial [Staurois parvus]